jgi:hypothetical protein
VAWLQAIDQHDEKRKADSGHCHKSYPSLTLRGKLPEFGSNVAPKLQLSIESHLLPTRNILIPLRDAFW